MEPLQAKTTLLSIKVVSRRIWVYPACSPSKMNLCSKVVPSASIRSEAQNMCSPNFYIVNPKPSRITSNMSQQQEQQRKCLYVGPKHAKYASRKKHGHYILRHTPEARSAPAAPSAAGTRRPPPPRQPRCSAPSPLRWPRPLPAPAPPAVPPCSRVRC